MSKDNTTTIKLDTLNGPVTYKFKHTDITEYPELKTRSYNVMRENAMFTKKLLLMEHGEKSITALIEGVLMYDVPNLNFNDNLEKLFSKIASCLEEHYGEEGLMDQPEPSTNAKRHEIRVDMCTFTTCDSGTGSQEYRLFYYRACLGRVTRHLSVGEDKLTITFEVALNTCDLFEKVQFFYKLNEGITEQTGLMELVEWMNEKKFFDLVAKRTRNVPAWPEEVIGAGCSLYYKIIKKDSKIGKVTYEILDQEDQVIDQFTIEYDNNICASDDVCCAEIGGERVTVKITRNVLSCSNAVLTFANKLMHNRSTERKEIAMEQISKDGYKFLYDAEDGLIIIKSDVFLVKRVHANSDLQAHDSWLIFQEADMVLLGRLDFFSHRCLDKLGEAYWRITARIEYNGIVYETDYHCASKECSTGSAVPAEEYVVAAIDHLLSMPDKIVVYKRQISPDNTKVKATDQKDTGYNSTGNCDNSLIITINDIIWLPNGDRQINISVKRSEQIYGYRRPEPIIKSMVLIESTSKSEYPFIVKQINSFTRLEGLDLPMKFKVGDTVSMMCALNSVVTTTIKLIQEKYRTVFDLLES